MEVLCLVWQERKHRVNFIVVSGLFQSELLHSQMILSVSNVILKMFNNTLLRESVDF